MILMMQLGSDDVLYVYFLTAVLSHSDSGAHADLRELVRYIYIP